MYYSLIMGVKLFTRGSLTAGWLGSGALLCAFCFVASPAFAQAPPNSVPPEFTQAADRLAADRAAGVDEPEATEEQALEILDRAALPALNAAALDLNTLNKHMAAFVTREPPLGESFLVLQLGGTPASFALLADFGEAGPSAVRVYAGAPGKLALAARVDRYAQKDFLDDYIEVVPLPGAAAVFVTVAGRTDDQKTGVFTAWYFDGHQVQTRWTSDILSQSSYRMSPNGFELDYCADSNPDDPGPCQQMQRDRFVWQDGAWKKAESVKLTPASAGQ